LIQALFAAKVVTGSARAAGKNIPCLPKTSEQNFHYAPTAEDRIMKIKPDNSLAHVQNCEFPNCGNAATLPVRIVDGKRYCWPHTHEMEAKLKKSK
jgi:hypothetical protein